MIPRALIPIIAVAVVCIIALYGYTSGNHFVHLMLVAAPVFMILAGNLTFVLGLAISLQRSGLIIPGLPQGFDIFDLVVLFLVGLIIATHTITKRRMVKWSLSHYFILGFLVVLILTIMVRGIGIRALGSNMWGGFTYIKLMIYIALYLVCGRVMIRELAVKRATLWMVILSSVPVLAQVIFYLSGGAIYQQYMFVQAYAGGILGTLDALETGQRTARFYFQGFGMALMFFALIFVPFRGNNRLVFIAILTFSMGISLLSGFRNIVIGTGASVFLFLLLAYPQRRFSIVMGLSVTAAIMLVALTPFIPQLPGGVQRALSWVPFYNIPTHIKVDAAFSLEWRLGIWEMAYREIPQYLLLGKGVAFHSLDLTNQSGLFDRQFAAFVTHNYHSGPISLLLDLGIFGIATATLFMLVVMTEGYRGYQRIRTHASPFIFRLYCAMYAHLVYVILAFFIIYGDLKETVPTILYYATLLQILRNNFAVPAPGAESAIQSPTVKASAPAPLATPVHARNRLS